MSKIKITINSNHLEALDKSAQKYSPQKIEDHMKVLLDGVSGAQNKIVAERVKNIKMQANALIKKNDPNSQTIFGKIIGYFQNAKAEFEASTQDLKEQIQGLSDIIEQQENDLKIRMPQMKELSTFFLEVEKQIHDDIGLADKVLEYYESVRKRLELELKENPEYKNTIEYSTLSSELNRNIQSVVSKKDEFRTKLSHYATLATTTSQSLDVAVALKESLGSIRNTVMPLWYSTAVSSTLSAELSKGIDFVNALKEGQGEAMVDAVKLSADNAVKISELRKDGILDVKAMKRVVEILEKAEDTISRNQIEIERNLKAREIENKEFRQKLGMIEEKRNAHASRMIGLAQKDGVDFEVEAPDEKRSLTEQLERLKKEMRGEE